MLVDGHRHAVAEQPVRRRVLAYGLRRLLQVFRAVGLVGGFQSLGVQFLRLLVVVVVVVVRRGPLVEVVAFGVVHQ